MESLISALLEYSTIASDMEEVKQASSLSQVLNDIKYNLQNIITERNVVIEMVGHLPMLKISRVHLTQLFQNIISNSIKFNNKKPQVQIVGKVENEQYIVEVKDNGIGMKMEYSDKIFRLFQRLSRSNQHEGTGIGLAICKQIVDKYEGTIRFESEENEGTTFIISFPTRLIDIEKVPNEPFNKDISQIWSLS